MVTHMPRWTSLGKGGRLVIPAQYRKALGLKIGDRVVVRLDSGELRIITPRRALERAQEVVSRYAPKDRSLAKELIEERRTEARRE